MTCDCTKEDYKGRAKDIADDLIAKGYRRVSNSYRHVSRIDDPNWHEKVSHLKKDGQAQDQYRRCYSKDKLWVAQSVYRLIPASAWDSVGYVE